MSPRGCLASLRRECCIPGVLALVLCAGTAAAQDAPTGPVRARGPVPPPRAHLSGRALVRQAGTEFSIAPLQGARDLASYYSYDSPVTSCSNTGLETAEVSLLFLYENTSVAPSQLGLVIIHDIPNDATGGDAVFDISGLPAASTIVVRDDSGDPYVPDPPAGGHTQATWSWSPCCTDGSAFDGLDTEPFCIALAPRFSSGISRWQLLDGPDTAAPGRVTLPNLTDNTFICGDCLELRCPSTITADCASGGTGHVDLVVSGSSLCGGGVITNDRTPGGADASGDYPMGPTRVTFTLTDGPGFSTTCSTTVIVQDDTSPPTITTCPPPLTIDCSGSGDIPATDPRIAAWLALFDATDACGHVTLGDDATTFPSGCNGTTTPVTFTATDDSLHVVTCSSSVTVATDCLTVPLDVGPALRIHDHGDPHAPDMTARVDWSLDFGLPRPPGEHYHLLRGTSPQLLTQVPGMEPWLPLGHDDSTPAASALPFVHFYVVLAASPCEDVSLD